jgi:hypothetical protein
LRQLVRAHDQAVRATAAGQQDVSGIKATSWKLLVGDHWTVPAVELVAGAPQKTALLVADGGRATAAADAARLLADGYRVVALDPFYLGESKPSSGGYLFALLVAAVGDRPLGLQASQLAAVARWCAGSRDTGAVTLVARGPRVSLAALVTAGLEKDAIARVELHEALGSLKEVIEQNLTVDAKPECFCFGLLEAFDIKHLAALSAPRPVVFESPSPRVKTELAELAAWYRLFGSEHVPVK